MVGDLEFMYWVGGLWLGIVVVVVSNFGQHFVAKETCLGHTREGQLCL